MFVYLAVIWLCWSFMGIQFIEIRSLCLFTFYNYSVYFMNKTSVLVIRILSITITQYYILQTREEEWKNYCKTKIFFLIDTKKISGNNLRRIYRQLQRKQNSISIKFERLPGCALPSSVSLSAKSVRINAEVEAERKKEKKKKKKKRRVSVAWTRQRDGKKKRAENLGDANEIRSSTPHSVLSLLFAFSLSHAAATT